MSSNSNKATSIKQILRKHTYRHIYTCMQEERQRMRQFWSNINYFISMNNFIIGVKLSPQLPSIVFVVNIENTSFSVHLVLVTLIAHRKNSAYRMGLQQLFNNWEILRHKL